MNASTTATVILIFVKTVRACWASFGDRLAQLNLAQRLPVMSLYSRRPSQILLFCYFSVVALFAAAGITYGMRISASLAVFFITILLLLIDVSVLAAIRYYTEYKENERKKRDKKTFDQEEEELKNTTTSQDVRLLSQHDAINTTNIPFLLENNKNNNFDGTHHSSNLQESSDNHNKNTNDDDDEFDEITAEEALEAKKNSLANSAPTSLPKALLIFLLSEEIPTILITLAIQLAYNYTILVEYRDSFGIATDAEVPKREYDSRSMSCVWELFESDLSGKINAMSSFFAFL